jgi:hypothetical protein
LVGWLETFWGEEWEMEELMRGGELMSFFDILMGGKFIAMKGGAEVCCTGFRRRRGWAA